MLGRGRGRLAQGEVVPPLLGLREGYTPPTPSLVHALDLSLI